MMSDSIWIPRDAYLDSLMILFLPPRLPEMFLSMVQTCTYIECHSLMRVECDIIHSPSPILTFFVCERKIVFINNNIGNVLTLLCLINIIIKAEKVCWMKENRPKDKKDIKNQRVKSFFIEAAKEIIHNEGV